MQGVITITSSQVHRALSGIVTQLEASDITKNYDSLADALEKLDMWDFLLNQAEVIASLHAFSTRDTDIINKLTHRREQ